MRLGAVSFPLTKLHDYGAWVAEAERWLEKARTLQVDLLVFPEYFTLALETHAGFRDWMAREFIPLFQSFSNATGMVVLAGTHNIGTNTAFLFRPQQPVLRQNKIHLIPSETDEDPRITPGSELVLAQVGDARLATTICYDVEFPELARRAVRSGTNLLLCPSWTEKADGFYRVRYCAHARAVENQLFVVHAPLVGSLEPWGVAERACGSAAILAPSDSAFPPNGVLAEGKFSEADLAFADVDFRLLASVRESGAVRTYRDFMNPPTYEVTPC